MGYVLLIVLLMALASCAMPSTKHAWCAPSGRLNREAREVSCGVRCYW